MAESKQLLVSEESLFNVVRNETWNTEYAEDYKNIIKQKELFKIPFSHQSPQIFYRKSIVEHLKDFAAKKQLSHSCLHLAVYMLDVFMDNHSILPGRLNLVANVCLLLAAKFEEVNANIPKYEELNNHTKHNQYSINDYRLVEIIILKFFHWYLMIPTPAHYTHYFMQTILEPEDLIKEERSYQTLMFELHEYITMYLDKMIDDIHLMQRFSPSKLAAAAISGARIRMGLSSWTESLQKLTGYSREQMYDTIKILLQEEHIICANCLKPTT